MSERLLDGYPILYTPSGYNPRTQSLPPNPANSVTLLSQHDVGEWESIGLYVDVGFGSRGASSANRQMIQLLWNDRNNYQNALLETVPVRERSFTFSNEGLWAAPYGAGHLAAVIVNNPLPFLTVVAWDQAFFGGGTGDGTAALTLWGTNRRPQSFAAFSSDNPSFASPFTTYLVNDSHTVNSNTTQNFPFNYWYHGPAYMWAQTDAPTGDNVKIQLFAEQLDGSTFQWEQPITSATVNFNNPREIMVPPYPCSYRFANTSGNNHTCTLTIIPDSDHW